MSDEDKKEVEKTEAKPTTMDRYSDYIKKEQSYSSVFVSTAKPTTPEEVGFATGKINKE
jgi:hypothetical protein